MMGPLREALIKAARSGQLARPPEISEEDWRENLARLYPDATPDGIAAARRAAEAMWADDADPNYGV